MAHDAAVAAILRAALAGEPAEERRMFGALCFMLRGNMLCGALSDGGFFRVGPGGMADGAGGAGCGSDDDARAADDGLRPGAAAASSPERAARERLLALATAFVATLPAK